MNYDDQITNLKKQNIELQKQIIELKKDLAELRRMMPVYWKNINACNLQNSNDKQNEYINNRNLH